jgi:hypothetical protein
VQKDEQLAALSATCGHHQYLVQVSAWRWKLQFGEAGKLTPPQVLE